MVILYFIIIRSHPLEEGFSVMFDAQYDLGLPLPLLPFTVPFSRVVCIELCLLICPKYFNFLIWMMVNRCFFIFNLDNTSLFVTFSVHDIFSTLL